MDKFQRVAVALGFATNIALAANAHAAGAWAAGVDPARNGAMTYGWTINYANEGEAKYQALVYCLDPQGGEATPGSRLDCKLLTVFNKQCMSMSWDPKVGETGWGWAVHADKSTAEKQAIDKCNAMPGASRTGYCTTAKTACDTTGSGAPAVASAPPLATPLNMATGGPEGGKGGKAR